MMMTTEAEAAPETPATEATPAAPEATTESVLFPNEGEQPKDAQTKDEAKPEGEGEKPEGEEKPADPADTVPEDGKYEFALPEGVTLDEGLASALMPEFKELGLTQSQAQKLVDKYIEAQNAQAAAKSEQWASTITGWVDQAKSDPEIGGPKWDTTVKSARTVIERFGTPELKEYLNASGGGNHPEIIRFVARVASLISEDNPATGGAEGAGKPADPAYVLFKNDVPTR